MRHLAGLAVAAILLVLLTVGVEGGYRGRMVGARREVKDVKSNKEIQDLGRFSVNEFNTKLIGDEKQKKELLLSFEEVIEAQTQVVSGIKYYLKILAAPLHNNSNKQQLYDAAVVVKPWLNHRSITLLHFRPSSTTATV